MWRNEEQLQTCEWSRTWCPLRGPSNLITRQKCSHWLSNKPLFFFCLLGCENFVLKVLWRDTVAEIKLAAHGRLLKVMNFMKGHRFFLLVL